MEILIKAFFYISVPLQLFVIAWRLGDIVIELKLRNTLLEEKNKKLLND